MLIVVRGDFQSFGSLEKAKYVREQLEGFSLKVGKPVMYLHHELSIESLAQKVGTSKVTLYKYIELLHKAELLRHVVYEGKRFKSMQKPDKLYLANTTLLSSLCLEPQIGTLRESFFASQLSVKNSIYYVDKGDFLINEKYTFEIGGKNKDFSQIKDIENSYIASDSIEVGFKNKIPLWIFGFLY